MDISVIYRQGNVYLLGYKGLDNKKHYIVKWRQTVRAGEPGSGGWGADMATETKSRFSVFQRRLKNRERAEKLNDKPQFDALKQCYADLGPADFKVALAKKCNEGVWGIELEDFIRRTPIKQKLFVSDEECYLFVQSCWLSALQYWQSSRKINQIRCLELVLNIEERFTVELENTPFVLADALSELKVTLQQQLEEQIPVNEKLMGLYVYYDRYAAAEKLSRVDGSSAQMVYMDALLNKAKKPEQLSFMSPAELAVLLEQVVACAKAYKEIFSQYSTGHHKWQQVTLCIGPLLMNLRDKINGNMYKNNVSTAELNQNSFENAG